MSLSEPIFFAIDSKSHVYYLSQGFERFCNDLFGTTFKKGCLLSDLLHEREYIILNKAIEKVYASPSSLSVSLNTKGQIWIVTLAPSINPQGEVEGCTINFRKDGWEEGLIGKIDQLFRPSVDLFAIADFNGHFIELSQSWSEVLGYDLNELKSSHVYNFIHPEDIESTAQERQHIEKEQTIAFENRYRCKNGSYKWLQWSALADTDKQRIYCVARDITEQREYKDKIEEALAFQKKMASYGNTGLWNWDLEDNTIYFSFSWKSRLGVVETEVVKNFDEWLDRIHPDDQDKLLRSFEVDEYAVDPTRLYRSEFRFKDPINRYHWILAQGKILIKEGKAIRMMGSHTDITESKKYQQIIEENVKKLDHTVKLLETVNEAAKIGTWEVDLANMTVSWSSVTKRIHEVASEYHPDVETAINFYKEGPSRETISRVFNEAIANGKQYDVELQLITAKGNERWIRTSGLPIFNEGICQSIYGTFQDITEQKKAEEALRENQARFEMALIAGNQGAWLVDWQKKSNIVDERWAGMLGYTLEEVGQNLGFWESRVHPDDLKKLYSVFEQHERGDIPMIDVDVRARSKNGEWKWISDRAQILKRTPDGQPLIMAGIHTDITERKQNEIELQKTKDLLTITNRIARIGGWEVDLSNNQMTWTDITREIHEVEPSYNVNVEEAINFYKEGASRQTIRDAFNEAVTKGKSYDVELEIISAKGNARWIRTIGLPTMVDGKCAGIFGTIQDITERKLFIQQIERLSIVASETMNAVVITDKFQRTEWVNTGFEKVTGYTMAEVVGKTLGPILQGPDTRREHVLAIRSGLASGKAFTQEILNYRKDGAAYWNELHITPVLDETGEVTQFIGIQLDITDRKHAEQLLSENEERIRAIADTIPGVLALYRVFPDGHDQVNYISDGVIDLWGISKEEALSDMTVLWQTLHPDDLERVASAVQSSVQNLSFLDVSLRVSSRTGELKWINARGVPKRMPDGSCQFNILVIEITELKQTQENLVTESNALKKALADKNILLQEVHHRVKNNLQLISSILMLKASNASPDLKTFVKETNNRIKSIAKIYNQLLKIKEFGHLNVRTYLTTLSKDIIQNLSQTPSKYQLHLDILDADMDIEKVMTLGLIVNEALSNTIKYAYPSGDGGLINISLLPYEEKLVLAIEDHGEGHTGTIAKDSLGITLINVLAEQLDGRIEMKTTDGFSYRIVF